MTSKDTQSLRKEEYSRDLIETLDYPTISDIMLEQNLSINKDITVHRRRDLDSLG